MGYGNWSGFGFMWLFPVLLLVVIVYFLRGAFTGDGGPEIRGDRPETAREILDRRFAAGEIDKDEYAAMKANLDS
jgi:putative membrane protein